PVELDGGPGPVRIAGYAGGPELLGAIEGGASGTWRLCALPGEQRGELICELVAAAGRARSGAALVAVPEVRYGSDVLARVGSVWPDIARVDTARPDSERASAWLRMAAGHGLAGGGRATVFVPAPELRLIVIDEEHHPTYKEDRAPRYDARRVAVERARLQGAVCVLISSTPSLEVGAAPFHVVEPSAEARRATRPVIELIPAAPGRAISRSVHVRLRDALQSGARAAVLVPRRGYARTLWCADCRRSVRCSRCEAGVSYERDGRRTRCPRCGLVAAAPEACPSCGARELLYLGAGSERLTEQIALAFPRASVRRVDPATVELDPADGPPDIYVTTWVGTKPELRPEVSLVVVLEADALIRRPDFRSAELAYQAFQEMASWAGPATRGGRLVIETSEPNHHAVQAVVRADDGFFFDRELEHRRELGYPPFAELVTVRASGDEMESAIARAAEACRAAGGRILGPMPVTASRGGERALEILVKCTDAGPIADALRGILADTPARTNVRVDVDPR
ncbi:MAG: replication restart helicase PriA, partial [Actinomycetota bacterium]